MHGPINVKSPNNTRKWQMGFNSAFKRLILTTDFIFTIDGLSLDDVMMGQCSRKYMKDV
jgi:hypothetical protein